MRNPCAVQHSFRVQEVLAFVLQRLRTPARRESHWSASAKPFGSLHADGQFGGKHAQVGADLAVENLSKLEIAEFAQSLCEQPR